MKFEYSIHWTNQRIYRPEITDDLIELCIIASEKIRDEDDPSAWNAIARIPPSGRKLKVAYKEKEAPSQIMARPTR